MNINAPVTMKAAAGGDEKKMKKEKDLTSNIRQKSL